MTSGKKLRQLIQEKSVVAPFVYDGMMAKMAALAGLEALYCTGGGNCHSRGMPDMGLITMPEMTDKIRILNESCDLPVIADADTGYGTFVNVIRTVRCYEKAGAAALHMEDQKWPKSCGFLGRKEIIGRSEAVAKIKAAVDTRNEMMIIGRTDAFSVMGWEEVESRVHAFMEAGADMAFVDGIVTWEEMLEYRGRFEGIPLMFNNSMSFPMKELNKAARFELVIHPGVLHHLQQEITRGMEMLAKDGLSIFTDGPNFLKELHRSADVMGFSEYNALVDKYQAMVNDTI